MNEQLSLHRLGLLLRGDAIGNYRTLAVYSSALASVMLITSLISNATGNFGPGSNFYLIWFVGMLFVWGTIACSYSFQELHDKTRNEAYLSLPASALEKTLARLLRITLGFVIYLLIFTLLTSWVVNGVNWLAFNRSGPSFQPFDPMVWQFMDDFIVNQSIYFLGAAWFRKSHFAKTALSSMIAGIGLSLIAALIIRITFGPFLDFAAVGAEAGFGRAVELFFADHAAQLSTLTKVLQVLYYVCLPLFCWSVAWMRVQETQVSHGV